jgi:hypothetical protein
VGLKDMEEEEEEEENYFLKINYRIIIIFGIGTGSEMT